MLGLSIGLPGHRRRILQNQIGSSSRKTLRTLDAVSEPKEILILAQCIGKSARRALPGVFGGRHKVETRMWVVHFTDKKGKATVSICQSRDAALKSARGLREHFCAVHYISGPNGARIELKEILDWCSQQARNVG